MMKAKDYYVLMESILEERQIINEENLEIKKPLENIYLNFKGKFSNKKQKKTNTLGKVLSFLEKQSDSEKFETEKIFLIKDIDNLSRNIENEIVNLDLKKKINKAFKSLKQKIDSIKIIKNNTNTKDGLIQVRVHINDTMVNLLKIFEEYNQKLKDKKEKGKK